MFGVLISDICLLLYINHMMTWETGKHAQNHPQYEQDNLSPGNHCHCSGIWCRGYANINQFDCKTSSCIPVP